MYVDLKVDIRRLLDFLIFWEVLLEWLLDEVAWKRGGGVVCCV